MIPAILLGLAFWIAAAAVVLYWFSRLMGKRPECYRCGRQEGLYPAPVGGETICRRCRVILPAGAEEGHDAA